MHAPRRSISSTTLAIIVIVVVVVAAVGGYAAYLATRHHVTTTTTTVTTTTTTVTVTTPITTTTTTPVTSTTFYTWWSTEGKIALNHFIPVFEQYNPPYTVSLEIIPGAGGTNAKFTIVGMMEAGKPPAAFQVHFGPEMASYALITSPKDFVNFTPIAVKMGLWTGAVTEVMLAGTFNGSMLSMPVNVHRGDLLYINIKLLREYNLPLPTNLSTLIYDTVQLAQHGVYPWMVPGADGGWDQLNLWQDIFLSLAVQEYGLAGGARLYNELAYGTINLANTSIQQLINETDELFLNFTSYDYPGWQSLTWTQGLSDLIEGKAAFQANGDWLTNYAYDFYNVTTYPAVEPYISWPNVTVVVEPFPGTNGTYALVIDSVGVPQPYPTTEVGIRLAEFWASYLGQETWTKWKATTFWVNATDYFNTPEQWWSHEQLVSTPADQLVYQLSDGGLFDDVFGAWISQLLALQETGSAYIPAYNAQLASLMHSECEDWLAAGKIGLGYLGTAGQPFAGYVPPWVIVPGYYFNSSYVCPTYTLP